MDRIRGFDGLRAIALIGVFLQHFTSLGNDYETGGYGVWLFFVLSGFLIVRILARERARIEAGATTVRAALSGFFWRRTLRIAPAYYLLMAVASAGLVLGVFDGMETGDLAWFWAQAGDLYFAFVSGRWNGPLIHLWSVAVEAQFYLLAAPVLLIAPARWARGLCAGLVVAALAFDVALRASTAGDLAVYANPLTNFGALAFGGLVGLGAPRRVAGGASSAAALAGFALMAGLLLGFPHIGVYTPGAARLISTAPFWLASLLCGLVILGVYANPESRVARALDWAPLAWLGRVSYGFYLYHNLLPRRLLADLGWAAPAPVEVVASFALTLALAALSWRFLERPALSLKDRPWRLPRLHPPGPAKAEA